MIFDESYLYNTKSSVAMQIAMNARIGLKFQVTATLGSHSPYHWCHQTMWLFSDAPEDHENDSVMEMPHAEALYSAAKSMLHAISTEDEDAQQDAMHQMIQIAKPWMIRRWSESKLTNGDPLVWILKANAHLFDLSGLRSSKRNWWLWLRDTLHRVFQEHGGFTVRCWHVPCWCGETLSIAMMFLDNGLMHGHSIPMWILQFAHGWESHFCECLWRNLRGIMNLTIMMNQERLSFLIKTEMILHSSVHLHKRQCYFVLFLAKFIIWSGGYPSYFEDCVDIFHI